MNFSLQTPEPARPPTAGPATRDRREPPEPSASDAAGVARGKVPDRWLGWSSSASAPSAPSACRSGDVRKGIGGLVRLAERPAHHLRGQAGRSCSITVIERGSLESAKNLDVENEVEGQTTIITILPEGTRVKKGETGLRARLGRPARQPDQPEDRHQAGRGRLPERQARPARSPRSPSRSTWRASSSRNVQTIKGEITLAESDLERAKDRLDWSDRMLEKGYVSELADHRRQASAQTRPSSRLEQAQTQDERAREVHQGQDRSRS